MCGAVSVQQRLSLIVLTGGIVGKPAALLGFASTDYVCLQTHGLQTARGFVISIASRTSRTRTHGHLRSVLEATSVRIKWIIKSDDPLPMNCPGTARMVLDYTSPYWPKGVRACSSFHCCSHQTWKEPLVGPAFKWFLNQSSKSWKLT